MQKSTNYKPNSKDQLLLPRGYISWSAMQTFKRDREQFIRHYIYGEPHEFTNPSMDFGAEFANTLVRRKKHDDPVMDIILRSIPKLPCAEYEIKAQVPSKYGKFTALGKLDQFAPNSCDFDEFKTGMRKWTQNTAQNHGQMKFYAMLVYLKFGIVASKKSLIWIETAYDDDPYTGERVQRMRLTGRFRRFEVNYSLIDLYDFMNEVGETAKEISDLYQEEITKLT